MNTGKSAMKARRSVYAIGKELPIARGRVTEILEEAAVYHPSSFNMQSARMAVLYGEQHRRLWELVLDELRPLVEPSKFAATEKKIAGFAAGHGTILFFDDTAVVRDFATKYALYADKFPGFALQANGMLQYMVWSALAMEGVGASLQHYNPLIDEKVKKQWNLPEPWELVAQMPFGGIKTPPPERDYRDPAQLIRVFNE